MCSLNVSFEYLTRTVQTRLPEASIIRSLIFQRILETSDIETQTKNISLVFLMVHFQYQIRTHYHIR